MNANQQALRKAAVLVAALDDQDADDLLERMSPEQAGLIRRMVVELDDVDDDEQREVMRDFVGGGDEHSPVDDAGVELELTSHSRSGRYDAESNTRDVPPFRFLHEAAEEDLGELLTAESPQVAAVVVSHLPPDQAARALAALPDNLQIEVVRRLARLDEFDATVLREVEAGLQQRYHRRFVFDGRRAMGLGGVKQILNEASSEIRSRWLASISRHDPRLADQLTRTSFSFADLTRLSDVSLRTVFESVDESIAVPALAGGELKFLGRVFGVLPRVRTKKLQRSIDTLGPTRLSDVDAAQEEVVAAARRLESLGRLEWRDAATHEQGPTRTVAAAA